MAIQERTKQQELKVLAETKEHQQPYAIIVGLDSIQGLQSARILADRNVPVIAIAKSRDHYSCRTNVCKEILFANTSSQDVIDLLARMGPTFQSKPVLFLCQDKNVLIVSKHRHVLEPWYHLILPDPEVVEMMVDKASFYSFAQENNFPIPRTFILHCRADAEYAASQLSYPCILKPPSRPASWVKHTRLKAMIAKSSAELLAHYNHCCNWAEVLIVQELIHGQETDHYTCNCYFDRWSEPVVTFTSRKIRQWPPQTGQACSAEEVRNDIVEQETVRLFRSVNYCGLGYLEMKCDDRSGNYFIIEPNIGRPTGRAAMAEASGVELLYTMYCDAIGRPLPENRQQKYEGVKWIHSLRDFQAALYHWHRGNLTISEWRRSVRGKKVRAIWSWRDPKPFLTAVLNALPVMVSPRERGTVD